MTCQNCGKSLPDDLLFCTQCGGLLDGKPSVNDLGEDENVAYSKKPVPKKINRKGLILLCAVVVVAIFCIWLFRFSTEKSAIDSAYEDFMLAVNSSNAHLEFSDSRIDTYGASEIQKETGELLNRALASLKEKNSAPAQAYYRFISGVYSIGTFDEHTIDLDKPGRMKKIEAMLQTVSEDFQAAKSLLETCPAWDEKYMLEEFNQMFYRYYEELLVLESNHAVFQQAQDLIDAFMFERESIRFYLNKFDYTGATLETLDDMENRIHAYHQVLDACMAGVENNPMMRMIFVPETADTNEENALLIYRMDNMLEDIPSARSEISGVSTSKKEMTALEILDLDNTINGWSVDDSYRGYHKVPGLFIAGLPDFKFHYLRTQFFPSIVYRYHGGFV